MKCAARDRAGSFNPVNTWRSLARSAARIAPIPGPSARTGVRTSLSSHALPCHRIGDPVTAGTAGDKQLRNEDLARTVPGRLGNQGSSLRRRLPCTRENRTSLNSSGPEAREYRVRQHVNSFYP